MVEYRVLRVSYSVLKMAKEFQSEDFEKKNNTIIFGWAIIATKTQRLFRQALQWEFLEWMILVEMPHSWKLASIPCAFFAWFLMAQTDSKFVGWLAGWLARGFIYRVLGHVWLFLWWFTIGGWELESLETKRSKKSKGALFDSLKNKKYSTRMVIESSQLQPPVVG